MSNFVSSNDDNMNIVITGSLGHISKPLAAALIQRGQRVTIVSSDLKKKSDITTLGAVPAIGSVMDAAFLTDTFGQADAVYCMTPPDFSAPDQIAWYESVANRYAEAIKSAGISRAIYLSSYGAHLPSGTGFITGSYRGEQILNKLSGVTLTHLRPTSFYYNLYAFSAMIRDAGFIGATYGDNDRLPMVSPLDIASAVVYELLDAKEPSNITYVSSDDRTCSDVARVLGTAIDKPDLRWNVLEPEVVKQSLLARGMPHSATENLVELGLAIHTGILREDYDQHKHFQGHVKLEDFAREFATNFRQSVKSH